MQDKFDWKKEYTAVIILNVIYIVIFYFIMTFNK